MAEAIGTSLRVLATARRPVGSLAPRSRRRQSCTVDGLGRGRGIGKGFGRGALRESSLSVTIREVGHMTVSSREQVQEGRTVERRSWKPVMFGPGMILGALGAAGVIVSMFLPWRDGGVYPSDIPVEFLWNRNADSDLSLLIVLIPLAVVLAIGAFVPLGAGAPALRRHRHTGRRRRLCLSGEPRRRRLWRRSH